MSKFRNKRVSINLTEEMYDLMKEFSKVTNTRMSITISEMLEESAPALREMISIAHKVKSADDNLKTSIRDYVDERIKGSKEVAKELGDLMNRTSDSNIAVIDDLASKIKKL